MTNLYKLMFSSTLIWVTLLTASSYSWVSMWMGLEINLLSIIPLMSSNKSKLSSESSLKYLITQTIASAVLLFAMSMQWTDNNPNEIMIKITPLLIMMSLMMKMGAAPLHFWFPEVMEGLSWLNSFIMMTWQKIAPLTILIYTPKQNNMLIIFIVTSLIIGGVMGINQNSLRKILAYSSINHVGWLLSALMTNLSVWMNYFCIYTFISANLILILKNFNIFYTYQIFTAKKNLLKISFLSNLLSMGGVPPFLGFLPKWMVLSSLTKTNTTLAMVMVTVTLITLFLYLRTMIPSLALVNVENKISMPSRTSFTIWWTNGFNILSLGVCTLWFNLT
uniref:NADH-ubiquinone oxidoreductase chain 2 n=1 Tax=Sinoxylon sp. SIN01 TaxID=1205585 RepID=A0A0S2MNK2_9COLE|nr:NADH deshydrogenase subunit 2 [Sinoxylon sp. SIN01]